MLYRCLLVTLGLSLCAADDKKTSDLDKLQGRWKVVANQISNPEDVKGDFAKFILVVKGDRVTKEYENGRKQKGSFKLAPEKSPKQIDFMWEDGGFADSPSYKRIGIYAVDGDRLQICICTLVPPHDLDRRPTDFTTERGTARWLTKFERLKE